MPNNDTSVPPNPGLASNQGSAISRRGVLGSMALAAPSAIAALAAYQVHAEAAVGDEDAQSQRDTVTVAGQAIAYTVTAGTLTIRDETGEPTASMFYVAYVADQPKSSTPRPVTFAYNGGPGSSSMFLHMGSIGPVRIVVPESTSIPPAPSKITKNSFTMLDKTDIVFLDAIGTGFSRPLGKAKESDFWGVDPDVTAFSRGIQRYLTINNRWNSPKFLYGESYGTLRTAILSFALHSSGVKLNGLIFQSTNLNHGIRQPGYDHFYVSILPSYAAVAWYHRRIKNQPASLTPFLDEVRVWARGPYAQLLVKGFDASPTEKLAVAQTMSGYTGLSIPFLLGVDLRVDLAKFQTELLRDRRRTVGRLDGRFEGVAPDAEESVPDFDASSSAIMGIFVSAVNQYLFETLHYKTKLSYRPNNYGQIGAHWDQGHKEPGDAAAIPIADGGLDLARAMRENPYLEVLFLNGYYDLATPFFTTEYDVKHMEIDSQLQKNITFRYYPSGHMIYTATEILPQFKNDLDQFFDRAIARFA